MSAPVVLSTSPAANAVDVVLGIPLVVQFDQAMDIATINDSTFAVIAPSKVGIVTPLQITSLHPSIDYGKSNILGTFSFSTDLTTVTFIPKKSLEPGKKYSVLLTGSNAVLTGDVIKNASEVPMTASYQFSFTTGRMDLAVPPPVNPQPFDQPRINPSQIMLRPCGPEGNSLSTIQIIFPSNIDPNSFNPDDLIISLEPILGDSSVVIPTGVTSSVSVENNILTITMNGLS